MNSTEITKNYQYKGSSKLENIQQSFFASVVTLAQVAKKLLKNEPINAKENAEQLAFDSAVFISQRDMYEFILTIYSHYADRKDRTFDQDIIFKKAEDIINNIDTDFNQVKPK